MGLGPLAIYLAQRGWQVSGEDDAPSPAILAQLKRAGVQVGAAGDLPMGTDLVVYSSAIAESHPTRLKARQRGLPQIRRGELLAECAKEKRLVAVCGSHGKTSATAMIITALKHAGWNSSYVLGGLFTDEDWAPAVAGDGDWMVAEIDESDGTIARFNPSIALAVNLDWDHPDHYKSLDELKATFGALFARTAQTVLGWDACAQTSSLFAAANASTEMLTFGYAGDFQLGQVEAEPGRQGLRLSGRFAIDRAQVQARGEFNALNAAGALAVVQLMGAKIEGASLAHFPGVRRRQTVLRQQAGLTVWEDYAHHPAEIRALLKSLRMDLGEGQRLIAVFQPHRFSRTLQFKAELATALSLADALHLLDVYPAGEAPQAGGTSADLYAELVRMVPRFPVNYLPGDGAGVLELLRQSRQPGDCIVFIGAGSIEQIARQWLDVVDEEVAQRAVWDKLALTLRTALTPHSLVKREELLAKKTTLRVGGAARLYVEPSTAEDLQSIVRIARAENVPIQILGRGSNLLVPDAGVDGVVIAMRHENWATFEPLADGRVRVGAGLRLKNLCGLAAKAGLQGFEFLEGIPGNVGGALRKNAGAMGGWMFDVVAEVEIVDLSGNRVKLARDELHVGYRHCLELATAVAIGAILRPVTQGQAESIGRQIDVYRNKRQESQPRDPSAGCIFKNPTDDSAGKLIEQCGLKGERIGDAEVSRIHGNFIVNRGHATSAEVIELVRRVRDEVQRQTGKLLEPEVLLYGGRWEDVL